MPKASIVEITKKLPNFNKRRILILGGVLLLLLALIPSYYFYSENQKLKNPTSLSAKEVENLVETVGKLIELPEGEDPTVATVADTSKLADQAFFKNAQNGDKVLIYTKAKKAILYRPSTNKIIEVAPVNLGQNLEANPTQVASPSASTQAKKSYRVVLMNGTKTSGLTRTAETAIKAAMPEITVVSRGNALSDYSQSIVVNLSGVDKATAESLAKTVKGKVGEMPEDENPVDSSVADFLIFLGPQ